MSSTASLKKFAASLRELPLVVGQRVAKEAAPILTALVIETSRSSEDAYGAAWSPGESGAVVTLRKSGTMLGALRYVAIGTRLRLALTTRYAKYVVGKRPVAPAQGAPLPPAYAAALGEVTRRVIAEALR